MAFPSKLVRNCTSITSKLPTFYPAFVTNFDFFFLFKNSAGATPAAARHCSSSTASSSSSSSSSSSPPLAYKIDHTGFLNPLDDSNPPFNNQLGVTDKITNRNPRVLEHTSVARRQEGWKFQAPNRNYENKLVLESAGRQVVGYVEHKSGERVVWASSHEHALMKRLYSVHDISAVKAVAQILARRCLKAGLHHVTVVDPPEILKSSERLKVFHQVLTDQGISLKEREPVLPPERFGVDYDVVDPNLYVDAEAETVVWPECREEYDPEKDVLWVNEGIERKHQTPNRTWEELRPLVDPEPKVYKKVERDEKATEIDRVQIDPDKDILKVDNAIKFLE